MVFVVLSLDSMSVILISMFAILSSTDVSLDFRSAISASWSSFILSWIKLVGIESFLGRFLIFENRPLDPVFYFLSKCEAN